MKVLKTRTSQHIYSIAILFFFVVLSSLYLSACAKIVNEKGNSLSGKSNSNLAVKLEDANIEFSDQFIKAAQTEHKITATENCAQFVASISQPKNKFLRLYKKPAQGKCLTTLVSTQNSIIDLPIRKSDLGGTYIFDSIESLDKNQQPIGFMAHLIKEREGKNHFISEINQLCTVGMLERSNCKLVRLERSYSWTVLSRLEAQEKMMKEYLFEKGFDPWDINWFGLREAYVLVKYLVKNTPPDRNFPRGNENLPAIRGLFAEEHIQELLQEFERENP